MVITMKIKELRKKIGITAKEASNAINIPLRTYVRYENDDNYGDFFKRKKIYESLEEKYQINENKGILSIEKIKECLAKVFSKYKDDISFCYLFGSYAKGYAKENSDIDLLISTNLKGMQFVGIAEELRNVLNKKIDLIRLIDLTNNTDLINEIMKDGIKIYG